MYNYLILTISFQVLVLISLMVLKYMFRLTRDERHKEQQRQPY